MDIETRVSDLEQRVAALEARQPSAHDTPATHPFMRGEPREPREPVSEDFQKVFGFWADPLGRRLIPPGSEDEAIWLTKQQRFGGIVTAPAEIQSGIARLIEHYNALDVNAAPEVIEYGNSQYLVFPSITGTGYGTPKCLMIGVRNFTQDALDGQMDWTIEQIEKRRAKA